MDSRMVATYVQRNATYFAAPPGTTVVAAAGGRVAEVAEDLVTIDHGEGLITTVQRVATCLVEAGVEVARGEPVALSGETPVEFKVALDGQPVDPFAREGEVALWITGNMPQPNDELFDDSLDLDLESSAGGSHARAPRLDLPFSAVDFDGVTFIDS